MTRQVRILCGREVRYAVLAALCVWGLTLAIRTAVADTRRTSDLVFESTIVPDSLEPAQFMRATGDRVRIRYPRRGQTDREKFVGRDHHDFCDRGADGSCRGVIVPTLRRLSAQTSRSASRRGGYRSYAEFQRAGYRMDPNRLSADLDFEIEIRAEVEYELALAFETYDSLIVQCRMLRTVRYKTRTEPEFVTELASVETNERIQAWRAAFKEKVERSARELCARINETRFPMGDSDIPKLYRRNGIQRELSFSYLGDPYGLSLQLVRRINRPLGEPAR
jgi:hypothetical protein